MSKQPIKKPIEHLGVVTASQQVMQYSAPIPPSVEFAGYERTLEGAANRILEMAEKEQAHRIEIEKLAYENTATNNEKIHEQNMINIDKYYRNDFYRLLAAFIVSIAIVAVGCYTIYLGHPKTGGVIITGELAAIIWAFTHREKKSKEFPSKKE